jgi:hypothetical protein
VSDDGIDVAGPLTLSLREFKRRCAVHIAEEQSRILSHNALIALLCDAVRLAREYEDRRGEKPCTIGVYCAEHGFEHGAEAEHMRAAIEQYLGNGLGEGWRSMVLDGSISPEDAVHTALNEVKRDLQKILDTVDARDSLAFLEADEKRARSELLRFLEWASQKRGWELRDSAGKRPAAERDESARKCVDMYCAQRSYAGGWTHAGE